MNAVNDRVRNLVAVACASALLHGAAVRDAAGTEVPLDLADRAAVTKMVREMESIFYRSVEGRDMGDFHRAISKHWRDRMTVTQLNEHYRLLMMLAPERRYWRGPGFALDWPVTEGEGGMVRVLLRYPAPDEHAFIEQVYLLEDGAYKLGGYHLEFRPYDEAWERHNRAMLRNREEGDAEKALEEGRSALRVAAALDPPKPKLTLISARNLAGIHAQLGRFAEALPLRFLALLVADRAYGRADERVAEQLDQMMAVLYLAGRREEGALCGEWAEAVRAAAGGDRAAKQRVEREMDLDRLKTGIPELAPTAPAEDPRLGDVRAKAKAGDARAQHRLASLYASGLYGLDKDPARAAEWMLKAAEQGLASAQHAMAGRYRGGLGVPRDIDKAIKWYGKAADQGYTPSMYSLGLMYESGHVVPGDTEKALYWFRLAAKNGSTNAADRIRKLEEKPAP